MEPDSSLSPSEFASTDATANSAGTPPADEHGGVRSVFLGSQGLRAGWSILIFLTVLSFLSIALEWVFSNAHASGGRSDFTAAAVISSEFVLFLALLASAALVARIEGRSSLLAFNLIGPRSVPHFFSGLAMGFVALSTLVGAMTLGGWMRFGPIALSGTAILTSGALWAVAFLLVGCVEEGIFRCYLQFTFTRGLNFWWALGIVGLLCGILLFKVKADGFRVCIVFDVMEESNFGYAWGVYAAALLGLLPCLWLHLKKAESASFWQAAWITSTLFGLVHTGNHGENWIGIFAAAAIGFVFCVSIKLTGSAWWAIGCHAAWDWSESYFYGTSDSGMVASGHLLTTTPVGNSLWSGGADGPEGSLLAIGVILLLLVALIALYGRRTSVDNQPLTISHL